MRETESYREIRLTTHERTIFRHNRMLTTVREIRKRLGSPTTMGRIAFRFCVLAACLVCFGDRALAGQPRLRVAFDEGGATVWEGDSPVLSFQSEPRSLDGQWRRASYVHPLYDLRGQVITEDFPEDHRHHRGIFWAWHQVWVGDTKLGDAWVCRNFDWDVHSLAAETPGDPVAITATTHWKSSDLTDERGDPIAVVEETMRIEAWAAQSHYRVVDFDLRLLALVEDVRIGGSEDRKGYGGFSPRLRMTGGERFVSSSGEVEPQTAAIQAGTWLNIVADDTGTAILVHRDNPQVTEESATWILRRSRSMQNAVYPGREPVAVSMDKPTRLRYRLVVHDGTLPPETLNALQADYWKQSSR